MSGLQSQDIVLAIHLVTDDQSWTFQSVGEVLDLSTSQVHAAWKRLIAAKLADSQFKRIIKVNLLECLSHSAKYFFYANLKGLGKGIPTAFVHDRHKEQLTVSPYVWEMAGEKQKGVIIEPIHRSALSLSKHSKSAHEILALFDMLRVGGAREKNVATAALKELIK